MMIVEPILAIIVLLVTMAMIKKVTVDMYDGDHDDINTTSVQKDGIYSDEVGTSDMPRAKLSRQ